MKGLRHCCATLFAGALLFSSPAWASNQTGSVTRIKQEGSRVFVELNGSRTTMPGCSCCNRWEISAATAAGQSMLSVILSAFAQNRAVQIYGTATCVTDTESISYINTDF